MNDAQCMCGSQRRGDLLGDGAGARCRQRPFAVENFAQHAPVDKLHDDAVSAVVGLVDVVHADGVGVLKASGHESFTQEPPDEILALRQRRVHDLQRAHFVEEQMEGLVDVPHTAPSHLGENAILVANGSAHCIHRGVVQLRAVERAEGKFIRVRRLAGTAPFHRWKPMKQHEYNNSGGVACNCLRAAMEPPTLPARLGKPVTLPLGRARSEGGIGRGGPDGIGHEASAGSLASRTLAEARRSAALPPGRLPPRDPHCPRGEANDDLEGRIVAKNFGPCSELADDRCPRVWTLLRD